MTKHPLAGYRSSASAGYFLVKLALPHLHQSKLSGYKKTVQDHEKEDDDELHDNRSRRRELNRDRPFSEH